MYVLSFPALIMMIVFYTYYKCSAYALQQPDAHLYNMYFLISKAF